MKKLYKQEALKNIENKISENNFEGENFSKIPEAWLIGGAELFNYALERQLIDEAYITQVSKNFHADLFLKISLLDYLKKEILEQDKNFSIIHYF